MNEGKQIMVFKTDVHKPEMVNQLNSLFSMREQIEEWTVDTEDIDNVLRIVCEKSLTEYEVISLMKTKGFSCEEMLGL